VHPPPGDTEQARRQLEIGGKGLFTQENEEALEDGRIDCAVHSMKDMPAVLPPGLVIGATPEREDVRDAFLSRKVERIDDLPQGAVLGTASLRRQAQALHRQPDLNVQMLRGNIDTRVRRLEQGDFDAILLAFAGLKRLGLAHLPQSLIDPVDRPPAPGQGALAIETRERDRDAAWLQALRHPETEACVAAERGALAGLEGSCRTAIGAHAWMADGELHLIVEALTPDGSARFRHQGRAELSASADPLGRARDLGVSLAQAIRAEAGDAVDFG
jgi:hydroxymethylbilane synthase